MAGAFSEEQIALIRLSSQTLAAWILENEDPDNVIHLRLDKFLNDREAALGMATIARLLCSLSAVVTRRGEVQVLAEMLEFVDRAQANDNESEV